MMEPNSLNNKIRTHPQSTEKRQLLLIQDIEGTQTRYDCGGMAAQTFLQGRWINGATLFEMEDFQVVYLN